MINNNVDGLVISCSKEGRITTVHFCSLGINEEKIDGKLFIELFRTEYIHTALDFINKIKEDSAAFGWELFMNPSINNKPFFFSGSLIDNEIFIIGSLTKVDFDKFIKGMMLINNEQINKIRELEKERIEKTLSEQKTDDKIFDELTRLNNELVTMQRELTKKNLELEELNKLKNQFIGMAAHDLRNPLGTILNYAEFLEDECDPFSNEQIEFLHHIKSQSSFMLSLVNDLLDVTSIESGSIKLSLEAVDVAVLIFQIIHLNKVLADKKEIEINIDSQIQSSSLFLDKGKIEQVITNLLTNAIKYSEKKTTITVSIYAEKDQIIISVKDQGQGIPKDELNLLFKPFQKTSVKSTDGEKSTGLGLFIVRKIVEAHKGKIWAESKPGIGSTFYVSLPSTR